MFIKELGLSSFGKFKDKSIKLKKGINLIFGENESGKSTIFSFIDGIFYGFAKDSTKRRLFTEELEKYRPWESDKYSGYIDIEYEDKYRLERNFNSNSIKFLNLSDYKDLSNDQGLIKYTNVKQFGAYFFDVNRTVFKNTFFIGQLKSEIDSNFYEVLKEKFVNFGNTKDDKFNVKKALDNLYLQREQLGRESLSKSEIGRLYKNIYEIKEKISNLQNANSEYNKLYDKYSSLKKEYEKAKSDYELYLKINEQKDFDKISKNILEIKNLEEGVYSISTEDYEDINSKYKEIEILNENIRNTELLLSLNIEEDKLEDTEIIEKDYKKLSELNKKILELNNINYSKEIELILYEIKDKKKTKLRIIILFSISIYIVGFIFILSIVFKKYYLLFLSLPFILYTYLRINKFRIQRDLIKRLEFKIDDFKKNSYEKLVRKKEIDLEYQKLFDRYGKNNKYDLESFLKNIIEDNLKYKVKKDLEFEESIKLEENLKKLLEKKKELNINIENKLNSLGYFDLKKFNEDFLNSKALKKDERIKNLENLNKEILKGRRLESLNHNIDTSNLRDHDKNFEIEYEELKDLEEEYIKVKERLKLSENILDELESNIEDLNYNENLLEEKIKKRNAYNRAINVIENISDKNKKQVFPIIISDMEKFLKKISLKYSKITFDKNFNIKLFDEGMKSYVDLENLSNGTIDQIYFIFRLAVFRLFFDDAPIIIDDHFLQYDDDRLLRMIEFLNDEFNKNQIIIFSATSRERNVMDKLNLKYNYINLGDL